MVLRYFEDHMELAAGHVESARMCLGRATGYAESAASFAADGADAQKVRKLVENGLAEALDVAGLRSSPTKIGKDEIYFLRDEYYAHLDPTVNRRQIGILGTFLKHYDNNIVEKMYLAPGHACQRAVARRRAVHCFPGRRRGSGAHHHTLELLQVMRRYEVKRLNIHDVKLNIINALGKGKCEGKWRSLPWARSTLQEIADYQEIREKVITHALDQ